MLPYCPMGALTHTDARMARTIGLVLVGKIVSPRAKAQEVLRFYWEETRLFYAHGQTSH